VELTTTKQTGLAADSREKKGDLVHNSYISIEIMVISDSDVNSGFSGVRT
jgi:hypothetical protein